MGNPIRWWALLLVAMSSARMPVPVREIHGVVAGVDATVASHYQHALICADANNNGACDPGTCQ